MITGTNTDCKVLNVEIQESTAVVKLLLYASKSTETPTPFQIYIQDKNSKVNESKLLSENIYWIDYNRNISDSSSNINVNKYLELKLKIDITNNNTSDIKENRWIRECYIHFNSLTKPGITPLWSSNLLTLISSELDIPQIKYLTCYSTRSEDTLEEDILTTDDPRYKININSKITYNSNINFDYNKDNFYYTINIKTPNDELLETFNSYELEKYISYSSAKKYNELVKIELLLKNKLGNTVTKYSKLYKPTKKFTNTFIKTKSGIKKCLCYYMVKETEGNYNA